MRRLGLVCCFVLLEGALVSVRAQKPISVTAVQNLSFGSVFPGVPVHILRTNATSSGQYNIRGNKNAGIQVTFTLPSTMAGPLGATMPISFNSTDGGYSNPQNIGTQVPFDPRAPYTTALDKNGDAIVYLGSTASPAVNQRAGSYTATITMTVVYFP